ncbi:MAG TPA: 3-phosphoglycerate dehydrogenase family protein [Rhodothermales bacterium]|nr:3-phosphoglycerate dehydrogenase family protein [Rhodothermales bacterium]
MNILIADKLADVGATSLEAAGHTVVQQSLSGDELLEALRSDKPQVLVVRSTKVSSAMMDANPNLELIVRAGAGYDTIDVEAASARGIFVANCPGKNAVAVAELTIALLLSMDRRIADNVQDARVGHWNKATYAQAQGVKGQTLGIIGVGSIGQAVITRAQALEMRVVAWSRSLTPAQATTLGVERKETPVEVAREADIVTLHVASTPETKHLANQAFFEAMKPGALFINTTRGAVVDEEALQWALNEKGIRAALDVFEDEPSYKEGSLDKTLAQHPNVYLTHHIGASTQEAQDATAEEAVRVITTYAETGHVPNCVNMAERSPASHLLTVRHLDRVGVLAAVLDEVRKADWNVQEMENLIFEGAKAACARIRFDGEPSDDVVDTIARLDYVLAVSLIAL